MKHKLNKIDYIVLVYIICMCITTVAVLYLQK